MNAHVIDSLLFKDHYGTEDMRRLFSDEALLGRWLDAEVALAQAEAEAGIIPESVFEEIRGKADPASFDLTAMREAMRHTSHPFVPFIRQLESLCGDRAGEYVHYGATTQDMVDTAIALQFKAAHHIISRRLRKLILTLREKTVRYRDTPMAGRTHGQHALPITLGFKFAGWLAELDRHRVRLERLASGSFVGQLAGAAGTLASLGPRGRSVQARMMELLGLDVPDIQWHTSRDRWADVICAYGMMAATVGKIANEIINLQRTEIAEMEEGFTPGKIGSSTMPHKRNPMVCEYIAGLSRLVRNQVPLALECMVQEHERDMGLWMVEWENIPELCIHTGAMLEQMERVLAGLIVYEERMRENLSMTRGLIVSERLMLVLGERIGKQTAHERVYAAAMAAYEQRSDLLEQLCAHAGIRAGWSKEELERWLDPEGYTGLSVAFVDDVLRAIPGSSGITGEGGESG